MFAKCTYLVVAAVGLWLVACNGGSNVSVISSCSEPAPLSSPHVQGAGPYVVLLNSGVNAQGESQRLGMKYGFTATSVFLFGFEADLDAGTVEQLRCETTVESIKFNDGTFGVL